MPEFEIGDEVESRIPGVIKGQITYLFSNYVNSYAVVRCANGEEHVDRTNNLRKLLKRRIINGVEFEEIAERRPAYAGEWAMHFDGEAFSISRDSISAYTILKPIRVVG